MSIKEHPPQHVPVLLDASLELLNPKDGENYLDLTAGYGGHASVFLDRTKNLKDSCLVDRDAYAIKHLQPMSRRGVKLLHTDFLSAAKTLVDQGRAFDIVLVDLGVSSPQLDIAERGFSFTNSGPLDMRMDVRQGLTAAEFVNSCSRQDLIDTIHNYGEETRSVASRYADAIIDARPINTTKKLAETIKQAYRGKWQRIHPATRTFQAIRIAINDELRQIESLMPLLPKLLNSGGRVGVISFHSLEDRIVKRYFKEQIDSGLESELEVLTKKPRSGTEDVHNPRARSAMLRAAVKK